ncbi:hypothetical protein KDN24_07065 [Bacillus sp. Bva_UNVM-123]|uniref:hypothetical protein n=1 Tax=Bacillus sp. Bva_UNVM-123 TaxID=2829798 RepID=UPI00391F8271
MLFAHKNSLVTVSEVEEDGVIQTFSGEFPIKKGELKITDEYGNSDVITRCRLNEYYVPVKKVKQVNVVTKSPFEEAYLNELAENYKQDWVNDEDYIFEDEVRINEK